MFGSGWGGRHTHVDLPAFLSRVFAVMRRCSVDVSVSVCPAAPCVLSSVIQAHSCVDSMISMTQYAMEAHTHRCAYLRVTSCCSERLLACCMEATLESSSCFSLPSSSEICRKSKDNYI